MNLLLPPKQIIQKCIIIITLAISGYQLVKADDTNVLTLGIHPYLPREEIKKRFTPLVNYINNNSSVKLKLRVSNDYETHIENLGNKVFDVAYMGPASYVQLTNKFGKHPLLARLEINGKPYFHGYIISNIKKPITKLTQLKGKRFAFGSPHSTMSYLVPRYVLTKAGVPLNSLGEYLFLGNHRNVALSVLIGESDAGAVKEEVYLKFKERGLYKTAISPPISEHVFITRQGLPKKTILELKKVLFNMANNNKGKTALTRIKSTITRLVPVKDSDYDNLRKILK